MKAWFSVLEDTLLASFLEAYRKRPKRRVVESPCADFQQDVAAETVRLLGNWSVEHPEYLVAGNEAGMLLKGEVRGADVAIWKRSQVGRHRGAFRRVPPVLAVEIAGEDEDEASLRLKAQWYLRHGVRAVWLVFPKERFVIVASKEGTRRASGSKRLPTGTLPGLDLAVQELFRQLEPRKAPVERAVK